jgi:DNA-binding transcriptional LysR family regulator
MYNKSLDVFKAVAESASFSKAAEQLFISHTAVIKQMNQLENHLGVKLVRRSNRGIILTAAGQQLYQETLQMIKYSDAAIQRVQEAHFASPQTFRIGTSILYPCNDFMDLWDKINEQCPQFQLKMVPFTDDDKRLIHLNEICDFLIGAFNNEYDENGLRFFPIGNYRFCLSMPRKHPLAKKKKLGFNDLSGEKLMIMKSGNSPINDQIRKEITANYPDVILEEIPPHYNLTTFNNCAESGCILLSLECWNQVHPALTTVKLNEDYLMPYGIILPERSEEKMDIFVKILQNIMN